VLTPPEGGVDKSLWQETTIRVGSAVDKVNTSIMAPKSYKQHSGAG